MEKHYLLPLNPTVEDLLLTNVCRFLDNWADKEDLNPAEQNLILYYIDLLNKDFQDFMKWREIQNGN
jgi:hypothetical protein